MKIINNIEELKSYLKVVDSVGFVPTMGALHSGHLSLIKQSINQNSITVVSIFVNPTQFLEGEDFDSYPSKIEADIKICEVAGVDVLFLPSSDEIYFSDESKIKAPDIRGYIFEGLSRPGHFDGVLQVVLKLFNIVRPTKAYFGKKDAQQLILIKRMVKDLFLDIDIIECDTIRDSEGLALSSRNTYLLDHERVEALALSKSLKYVAKLIGSGIVEVDKIKKSAITILKDIELEYFEIVDYDLKPLHSVVKGDTLVLVAARVGTTRLIDNLWI
jgi:pantoate--beta-alanine ligase